MSKAQIMFEEIIGENGEGQLVISANTDGEFDPTSRAHAAMMNTLEKLKEILPPPEGEEIQTAKEPSRVVVPE